MRSTSRRIKLDAHEWRLVGTLREELGLEVTQLLRLGLRALVCLGVTPVERSSLQGRMTTVRPNHEDLLLIASLRKEFGKVSNSAIYKMALHALSRKEQLARAAIGKERIEPGAVPDQPSAAPVDVVTLEPKCCEGCGKSFLRVIGGQDKLCSGCEVSLEAAERAAALSLERAKRECSQNPGGGKGVLRAKSDRSREPVLTLPISPAPTHDASKVSRGAAGKRMTIVRQRRRGAAIANGIRANEEARA